VEKPLLATAIAYKTVTFDVLDQLKADDFNYRLCRDVYDALNDLYRLNKPIDMLTVYETMKAKPHCAYVNLILLTQLCQESTIPSMTDGYIEVIKKHSIIRKLHEFIGDVVSKICRKVDPNIILENIRASAEKIENSHSVASESTLKDLRAIEIERIREERKLIKEGEKPTIKGIPTGYAELDQKYLGWNPGELHIIAARPGIGKTSFALNLLKRICFDRAHKGLFFSLEMTSRHICLRALSICHKIAFWRLDSSVMTDDQFNEIDTSNKIENSVVSVFDFDCVDFSNIRREAKRVQSSRGLDIIFVDYLQLMKAAGRKSFENRHVEVSEITRGLKLLAKELSVPIVALSQLSRNVNENERPSLRDLKESGSIEQDADSVMLLYRPISATPQIGEKQPDNCINIDIAKNRNGPTGIVQLIQHPEFFIFENVAKESESWLYSVNSNIFKKVVE
jgi:replicative DNA helicase